MKPLTSLLLLLLWVYWQAANIFTAYTDTRSPGVPRSWGLASVEPAGSRLPSKSPEAPTPPHHSTAPMFFCVAIS